MGIECQHGQLARVCELCERDTEIIILRDKVEELTQKIETERCLSFRAQVAGLEDRIAALEAENAELKDELASALEDLDREVRIGNDLMKENIELRKDAERYRWLRNLDSVEAADLCDMYSGSDLDAAIDAAKEAQS